MPLHSRYAAVLVHSSGDSSPRGGRSAQATAMSQEAFRPEPSHDPPELSEPAACRGHRRGPRWAKVSYGLHRPASELSGLHEDLLAWQLVLPPSGVFTHLTAAQEYGLWLPPLPAGLPVFASMSRDEPRPRRDGLRATRLAHPPIGVVHNGVRLASPEEALLACACDLGILDLGVLCDAAVHLGLCTLGDIERAASLQRRGAPRLRQVAPHVDRRSESAWETLLRILHRVCDVPVEPQAIIRAPDGTFVAQGDLLIKGTRTLHEYDGEDHLKRPRQRKDLKRNRRLDRIEYIRRGYTSHEVLYQAVGILRDADASLGRKHRPERIRKWHALLADSLFTPSGTQRFLTRLG